jgi:transposase-like protein
MPRHADPALRRRWQTLIDKHSRSGLSVAEFCRRHQCSTASFYLWRRKLDQLRQAPAFLPVNLRAAEPRQAHFRVRLASGAVIEIPDRQIDTLLQLVDHLERHTEAAQP